MLCKTCVTKNIFCRWQEWGDELLIDVSDVDGGINLASYPTVNGMLQPDAIQTFEVDGDRCEFYCAVREPFLQ